MRGRREPFDTIKDKEHLLADIDMGRVQRLSPQAYNDLENKLSKPFVQASTTDLQAGFMLGIQYVLNALRTGYVTGT